MASWILVPCLVSLRNEFNALAPGRDKASDGSIGNAPHAAGCSDHNPDETGNTPARDDDSIDEVHAIDVDSELRKPGWPMSRAVGIIVDRHRRGVDQRLQNVIYDRRIASRSWGWTWRPYAGASPHTEHAHFSSRYTSAQEADMSPWGLLAEEDTVSQEDVISALLSTAGQQAIGAVVARALKEWVEVDPFADPAAQAIKPTYRVGGAIRMQELRDRTRHDQVLAGIAALGRQVAAGPQLDPAKIAAAIPDSIADHVVDALIARLAR